MDPQAADRCFASAVATTERMVEDPVDGMDETRRAVVSRCLAFDNERLIEQDVAFGFRRLVDIALQALSSSLNAPTTASQVIDELHDLLRKLAIRRQPSGRFRDENGGL